MMTIETYIAAVMFILAAVNAVIAVTGWSRDANRLGSERVKNAFLKEINSQQREEIARLKSELSLREIANYDKGREKK